MMISYSRRAALAMALSAPSFALAGRHARRLEWGDLIPPGASYAEIIGEGEIDYVADTWKPVYDANATKLNPALDGACVRLPGYIVPLEFDATGVTDFILVPYIGACVHYPPPPANQLVLVTITPSWPSSILWDPVWVTGEMRTQINETDLAQIGYTLTADKIKRYL